MNITEVRVSPREDGKLKAFASITLDNCFVIRGLKIIEGQGRLFVAMPSRRRPDGSFQDVCHPITNEFRADLEREVLKEYTRARDSEPVPDPGDL
jgi:stage V sporulation protein G